MYKHYENEFDQNIISKEDFIINVKANIEYLSVDFRLTSDFDDLLKYLKVLYTKASVKKSKSDLRKEASEIIRTTSAEILAKNISDQEEKYGKA